MKIEITGEAEALECDIKRVIDILPSLCCDTVSLLFITQTLIDIYKEVTGKDLKL